MADDDIQTPPPDEPTIESLRADLERERQQNQLYKDTLSALGSGRPAEPPPVQQDQPPPPAQPAATSDADLVARVARETGLPADQLGPWVPVIRSLLRAEAEPVMQTLVGVAQKTVDLEAQLTIDDWKIIGKETRKIMTDYRRRGLYIDPKDAADIARSRKAPELTAAHDTAADESQRARSTAAATSSATSGGATQTAGPKATKTSPPKPTSRADIERLPAADRLKAIEDALGDSRF